MPLLMCPNDNASMQTLERNGVQFDMCPTCRGVWLDRGELEKLMEGATNEGRASVAAPSPQTPPQQHPQPWGQQHPQQSPYRSREDDYRRHKEDERYYKKKKRLDIFDIFD